MNTFRNILLLLTVASVSFFAWAVVRVDPTSSVVSMKSHAKPAVQLAASTSTLSARPQFTIPEVLRQNAPLVEPNHSPFIEVAQRVIPAVVSIEGYRLVGEKSESEDDRNLFRRLVPDDTEETELEIPSSGSGFIVDGDGFVMTNDHVISGNDAITVHLDDGRSYPAQLIGTDPGTDVAVIKIDLPANDPPLPVVPLGNSDGVQVGEWSIAVGNPLGELESSMTVGVVSAKGRRDLRIAGGGPAYQNFLQTDASINFGNSGGPLVNVRGEVIGINSAVNPTGQGLGFAIPINMAREVAAQLISEGVIRRGYLGIVPWPLNEDTRARFEIEPENTGVLVGTVEGGTPADEAGLQAGDVIVEFNGSAVEDVPDFRKIVADAGVGENVSVLVERDGRMIDLGVILALRPDTPEQPQRAIPTEEEWLGLHLEQVTRRHMLQFNLQLSEGLVVSQIDMSRPAAESGIKVGDVLLEIDDRTVDDLERFREIVSSSIADEAAMEFLIQRGRERLVVRVNSRG